MSSKSLSPSATETSPAITRELNDSAKIKFAQFHSNQLTLKKTSKKLQTAGSD